VPEICSRNNQVSFFGVIWDLTGEHMYIYLYIIWLLSKNQKKKGTPKIHG
jgi:hypothetical protein